MEVRKNWEGKKVNKKPMKERKKREWYNSEGLLDSILEFLKFEILPPKVQLAALVLT